MTASSVMALLLLAAAAFSSSKRHYSLLPSVHFHNKVERERNGKAGTLVVFLDEGRESHAEEERAFNMAARDFHCLPPGGVHAVFTGEDGRAKMIREDLEMIHGLPEQATPPVAAWYKAGKPIGWYSAVAAPGGEWTAAGLRAWAWGVVHVTVVSDEAGLSALRAAQRRVAVGSFADLCSEEARTYSRALEQANKVLRGRGHPPVAAAATTNLTLGHAACGDDHHAHGAGVCVLSGGASATSVGDGVLYSLPDQARGVEEMGQWLLDVAGRAGSAPPPPPTGRRGVALPPQGADASGKAEL